MQVRKVKKTYDVYATI